MSLTPNPYNYSITLQEPATFVSIGGSYPVDATVGAYTITVVVDNPEVYTLDIPAQQGPAGPAGISFIPRGNYSSLNTYAQNDLVFYQGSSYVCNQFLTINQDPLSFPLLWTGVAQQGIPGPAIPAYGLQDADPAARPLAHQFFVGSGTRWQSRTITVSDIPDLSSLYAPAGTVNVKMAQDCTQTSSLLGIVDGINQAFKLSHTPLAGSSLAIYLNGLLYNPGDIQSVVNTINTGTIVTISIAPLAGDILTALYLY